MLSILLDPDTQSLPALCYKEEASGQAALGPATQRGHPFFIWGSLTPFWPFELLPWPSYCCVAPWEGYLSRYHVQEDACTRWGLPGSRLYDRTRHGRCVLREIEGGLGGCLGSIQTTCCLWTERGAGYGDFQITLQCVSQWLSLRMCVSSFPSSVTAGGAWGTGHVHRDSSPAAQSPACSRRLVNVCCADLNPRIVCFSSVYVLRILAKEAVKNHLLYASVQKGNFCFGN